MQRTLQIIARELSPLRNPIIVEGTRTPRSPEKSWQPAGSDDCRTTIMSLFVTPAAADVDSLSSPTPSTSGD